VPSAESDAQWRNEDMVEKLEGSGVLRDPPVATAFRAVLRHHFLPGRPFDEVYEDAAIMTKIGDRGLPVSSSSQPAIMAIMLQQLGVQPGHRVLEVGAGTGYNAALLAHLVGRHGRVVTVDIDADLVEQAQANLAAAGVEEVAVVLADGAGGWPPDAPYDRIVLTIGVDDLSPAWLEQLVEDGRMVVPLDLGGRTQQCVAFQRRGEALVSAELATCGFMPLRGEMAPGQPPGDPQVTAWLEEPARRSAHSVPRADLRAGFETWLWLTHDRSLRTRVRPEDPLAFGLRDERGMALVLGDGDENPVMVYGDGDAAAEQLATAHRAWAATRPELDRLGIEAHPTGRLPALAEDARVIPRTHFTFVVRPS
jgi:protein-L-isoaspartate(D-aspartate) O-methyltransferase